MSTITDSSPLRVLALGGHGTLVRLLGAGIETVGRLREVLNDHGFWVRTRNMGATTRRHAQEAIDALDATATERDPSAVVVAAHREGDRLFMRWSDGCIDVGMIPDGIDSNFVGSANDPDGHVWAALVGGSPVNLEPGRRYWMNLPDDSAPIPEPRVPLPSHYGATHVKVTPNAGTVQEHDGMPCSEG